MAKPKDDLEAVRAIADTLESFSNDERERIIRWAREKLGMTGSHVSPSPLTSQPPAAPQTIPAASGVPSPSAPRDIRSFIQEKDPKNDSQMAAVVAYYHHFVAPESERKESITSADLIEACRQAERARPTRPAQTLVNAYGQGLLNRGEHGHYSLNSVGENLVAMVLPDNSGDTGARRTANRRPAKKKTGQKKQSSKKKPEAAKKKSPVKKTPAKKKPTKKKSPRSS